MKFCKLGSPKTFVSPCDIVLCPPRAAVDRNELGLELEASVVDCFSSDDPLVTLVIRPWGVDIALVCSIELEFSERRRFSCLASG